MHWSIMHSNVAFVAYFLICYKPHRCTVDKIGKKRAYVGGIFLVCVWSADAERYGLTPIGDTYKFEESKRGDWRRMEEVFFLITKTNGER